VAAVRDYARRHRSLLLASTAFFLVAAFAYATLSAPRYRASALVTVVESSGAQGLSLPGQLGSLASLAGVTLAGTNERAQHVAFLRSRALAEEFIRAQGIALLLDPELAELSMPPRVQSAAQPPSWARAVRRFTESVCSVREDNATGLITVTIRWRDPTLAADWANALVALANERSRQRAIAESARTIAFLARELEKTDNIELQRAIHRLTQSQLQVAALASVRSEYALRVIDPARPPERADYVWPRHGVLLPLGLVVGVLAGALIALLREWAWPVR
jgi:uncharacterized protein involved in exopolysaccharide biosynthesis